MTNDTLQVGMSGVDFNFQIVKNDGGVLNCANAVKMEYRFQKPDRSMLIVVPSFKTNGTDGKLTYSSGPNDLDMAGTWKYHVYVKTPTSVWLSGINKFKVKTSIDRSIVVDPGNTEVVVSAFSNFMLRQSGNLAWYHLLTNNSTDVGVDPVPDPTPNPVLI